MSSIGSVSVEVVPDASGFAEKLKAKFSDLKVSVKADLDDAGVKAKLDELGHNRDVKFKAIVSDNEAKAKLDELARTRRAKIDVDVNQRGVGGASNGINGLTSELFSLKGAALTVGPALIPATAAIVGLVGALSAPIAAAGLGAGIFGGITIAALAKAKKDAKDIADLRKKATASTDPAKAAAFTKQADQMFSDLSKSEQKFLLAQGTIKQAFNKLLDRPAVGGAIFGTLTGGADLLAKVLPKTAPLLVKFGAAIQGLERDLSNFSDSSRFTQFIAYLSGEGTRAFSSFATIAGHLALGIGSIFKALTPMGQGLLDKFAGSLSGFDNVGRSGGFQSFLKYVSSQGPKVARTAGDIATAVGHLVLALAPQGSTMLGIIDGLAKTVAKMRPGQIAAIAVSVGALGLATGKFSKLTSLSLLISGLSYAYQHSSAFRVLADDAGRLAKALNSLPSGAKLGLAATLGASALSLRGKGVGGGGIAGVASKLVGGGVQKVFVTNPGFGGVGPGGKVLSGAEVAAGAGAKPVLEKAGAAATVAAFSAKFLPKLLEFAGHVGVGTFAGSPDTFKPGQAGASKGAIGAGNTKAFLAVSHAFAHNLTDADDFNAAVGRVDASFVKLAQHNPDKALLAVQSAAKKMGLPVKDLAVFLPKTAAALGDLGRNASAAVAHTAALARSNAKSMYSFRGLREQVGRAGISVGQYQRLIGMLPSQVLTKIRTPGSLESLKSIKALGRQFGLTPKQVRAIVKLVGARDADKGIKNTQRNLNSLGRSSAKPQIHPQGAEDSVHRIKNVGVNLLHLSGQSAKPKVFLQGAGKALSDARAVRDALNSIHSKSATLTLYRVTNISTNKQNAMAKRADGGWIFGPGTARSDSIPAMLSDGEFVVNAAAAQQNKALLEAINGGKGSTGQTHFATGGSAQSAGTSAAAVLHIYDTDGRLMESARVMARSEARAEVDGLTLQQSMQRRAGRS